MLQIITGDVGRITWGYQLAATTGRFELRPSKGRKDEFLLRAPVASSDPFRLRQSGLSFEITVFNTSGQSQVWKWPVTSIEVKDGVITAVLAVKGKV